MNLADAFERFWYQDSPTTDQINWDRLQSQRRRCIRPTLGDVFMLSIVISNRARILSSAP